jgi:uncharacterized membrane protein
MSTAKIVLSFIIGLLLAILVFPANIVSAVLGYLFGVIALVIGVWLAKRLEGGVFKVVLFDSVAKGSCMLIVM